VSDRAVILDVDGTLVDTNYQHALAWFRALRAEGVTVPIWQLHRAIGMGGDRLIEHVAGGEVEAAHGDAIRKNWKHEFEQMIDEVVPLPGAHELLVTIKRSGLLLVLASSGDPAHIERYRAMLDADELTDATTTAADADTTKPAPDLIEVAAHAVSADEALVVGDSPWDCAAAARAELPCVAVRTGGFAAGELREAGALRVFSALPELGDALGELPFAPITPPR
jgi:phosphoglycolate phosphatase-like HAD superfamily hydrolase